MFQPISTQCEVQRRETLGCWDDAKVMLAQKAGEEICDLAEAECREERWETLGNGGKPKHTIMFICYIYICYMFIIHNNDV